MNADSKKEIISKILALVEKLADYEEPVPVAPAAEAPVEMLTINECTEQFHGLTSYTLRKLAAQGKVKFTRAGEGTRGKILINKDSLISYLQK